MHLSLYGLAELDHVGHDACNIAVFCRNPLHPGPCKGWRHTLKALEGDGGDGKGVRKPNLPNLPHKTGPRDGDGDGKTNEHYVKKGRPARITAARLEAGHVVTSDGSSSFDTPKGTESLLVRVGRNHNNGVEGFGADGKRVLLATPHAKVYTKNHDGPDLPVKEPVNKPAKATAVARVRPIAAGQRGVLDSLAEGKSQHLTSHQKRDVTAAQKKGWIERSGTGYALTEEGRAAHEADKAREAKKAGKVAPGPAGGGGLPGGDKTKPDVSSTRTEDGKGGTVQPREVKPLRGDVQRAGLAAVVRAGAGGYDNKRGFLTKKQRDHLVENDLATVDAEGRLHVTDHGNAVHEASIPRRNGEVIDAFGKTPSERRAEEASAQGAEKLRIEAERKAAIERGTPQVQRDAETLGTPGALRMRDASKKVAGMLSKDLGESLGTWGEDVSPRARAWSDAVHNAEGLGHEWRSLHTRNDWLRTAAKLDPDNAKEYDRLGDEALADAGNVEVQWQAAIDRANEARDSLGQAVIDRYKAKGKRKTMAGLKLPDTRRDNIIPPPAAGKDRLDQTVEEIQQSTRGVEGDADVKLRATDYGRSVLDLVKARNERDDALRGQSSYADKRDLDSLRRMPAEIRPADYDAQVKAITDRQAARRARSARAETQLRVAQDANREAQRKFDNTVEIAKRHHAESKDEGGGTGLPGYTSTGDDRADAQAVAASVRPDTSITDRTSLKAPARLEIYRRVGRSQLAAMPTAGKRDIARDLDRVANDHTEPGVTPDDARPVLEQMYPIDWQPSEAGPYVVRQDRAPDGSVTYEAVHQGTGKVSGARTVRSSNPEDRGAMLDVAGALNLRDQASGGGGPAPDARSARQKMAEHASLTREQFDALPEAEQKRVLDDLRAVRDSGDTKTIPSNRTSMGTTIRGATADHVHAAQVKFAELTRAKADPADHTVEGRARRAAAGDQSAITGTMEELQAIASANKWGHVGSWGKVKAVDYLRNHATAHDVLPPTWSSQDIAATLKGVDSRKALAVLDIRDAASGLTLADLDAVARFAGVAKPKGGSKRAKFLDLASKLQAASPDSGSRESTDLPPFDVKNAASTLDALDAAPKRARVVSEAAMTPQKRRELHQRLGTLGGDQARALGGTGQRAEIGAEESITGDQRKAITEGVNSYMQTGYFDINGALHNAKDGELPAGTSPEVRARVEALDKLLELSVLDRDAVYYRGTKMVGEPPDELYNPGFSSMTASDRVARDFAMGQYMGVETGSTKMPGVPTVIEIRARKGTHGVQLSPWEVAAEVLSARGMRMRKVEDRGVINNVRHVAYEVIPDGQ